MGNLFDQKFAYNQKYRAARLNLLLVVSFTLVNLALLLTGSGTYFLFSASIPYAIVDLFQFLCGEYPASAYAELGISRADLLPSWVLIIAVLVAFALLALYVLCICFSRRHRVGWLITALVFFSLDTLGMFLYFGISLEMLFDIAFHAWILAILSIGIHAHYKYLSLPDAPPIPLEGPNGPTPDSVAIRPADPAAKSKIYVEAQLHGHTVMFRRANRKNEIVIDNMVYAESVGFRRAQLFHVVLDGHVYSVGFEGIGEFIILLDGKVIVEKFSFV